MGLRRLPGRRHGPGQDGPDARPDRSATGEAGRDAPADAADLPDVGRRQLAEGGRRASRPTCRCWSTTAAARQGRRLRASRPRKHALVISSYALLHRDLDAAQGGRLGRRGPRRGAEHQEPARPSRRRRRARSPAGYRVALTGTPVENHVGDLWSIMEFLNPGFLGTQAEFRGRFFVPIQAQRDPTAADAAQAARPARSSCAGSRPTRSIIADLPEKMEMKVFCTLTREQASLYAGRGRGGRRADRGRRGHPAQGRGPGHAHRSSSRSATTRRSSSATTRAIAGRSGKLARLTEMLEEVLEAGDRALIFTQFAEMGDDAPAATCRRRSAARCCSCTAASPKTQRDRHGRAVPERRRRRRRVFILSLKAGGTGPEPDRAPTTSSTSTAGGTRPSRTRRPTAPSASARRRTSRSTSSSASRTLEEKIDEMIERKQEVAGRSSAPARTG